MNLILTSWFSTYFKWTLVDLDIKNPTKQEEVQEYNSSELMELLHTSFEKSNALLNQLKQAVK